MSVEEIVLGHLSQKLLGQRVGLGSRIDDIDIIEIDLPSLTRKLREEFEGVTADSFTDYRRVGGFIRALELKVGEREFR